MKKIINSIKRIKLSTLIILIVLLAFTSYAWFVFISTVSTGLDAHVVGWKVTFSLDDEEVRAVSIDVGRIYPGMPNFQKNIVVRNSGEVDGQLSYDIQKMVILGNTYEISNDTTSADLEEMLENDFPFSISVLVDGTSNNDIPINSTKNVTITVSWPLDGDDEIDTQWGEDAYDYYQENGVDSVAIHIELLLRVEQKTT